jgi:serine/threonine protein kinase/CRP-like cAMP-binding protein
MEKEQHVLLELFQKFHVQGGLSITEIREITAKVFVELEEYIRSRPARRVSVGDDSGTAAKVVAPAKKVAPRTRAVEIFGGDDDNDFDLSESNSAAVRTKIPKPQKVMDLLKKSLLANAMFSDLDDTQIHEICECMEGVVYKKDDVVFRLGHPGDFFYVVDQGSCDVYLTKEEDTVVQSVGAGGSFGELALLYNNPRAATVKASEQSRLWRVHGNTFKAVVVESTYKKRKYFETLLDRVPLLSALKDTERAKIADALEEVTFPPNHIIIRQNDHGDYFYFCMEGKGRVTKVTDKGVETEVMLLNGGDYFGELALLTDSPRRATITSTTMMKCARMHRRDFNRLLGPLQDILTFRKEYDQKAGALPSQMTAKAGPSGRRASISMASAIPLSQGQLNALESHEEDETANNILEDVGLMSPRPPEFDEEHELQLEDFEVGITLGLGSFGRVRLCKFKETGKYYALKMMNKHAVLQMKQLDHIKSEKNILLQISYPFVVNMFGTFQDDEIIYMVFEFVCGGEFFTLLRNEDKLPNEQATFYAAEIVLTLGFLHNLKIVYRDLKPENILIDKDGHMKITDFGFAKEVTDRTWTLCGTPDYIAPEIIRNKGHNKGADWWAFGVLLFEMLAGYPPFYDESGGFGTYKKILKGAVEYPDWFTPDAIELISKLLVADLGKRYGNMHKGAADIMDHAYFEQHDWSAARKKQIPVPMIPDVDGENDTSYFEEYDDDDEHMETVRVPCSPFLLSCPAAARTRLMIADDTVSTGRSARHTMTLFAILLCCRFQRRTRRNS